MNKIFSPTLFFIITSILLLSSCNPKEDMFTINGEISSAKGEVLYLEHRGLAGVELLDSTELKENGRFSFEGKAPQNPEFYQLRLGEQLIVFAVDSIETLTISADGANLYNTYKIEPAIPNGQIKKIMDMQFKTKKELSDVMELYQNKQVDEVAYMEKVDAILSAYKTKAGDIILGNPASAAAYYAVFQKIDDYLIFDPYNREDYSMFGAVATSWNSYYPNTQRTKHLYDFTINALRVRKQQEKQNDFFNTVAVTESQLPDITLSDVKGEKISLSSLKGNYVLLDFTAYKSSFSLHHNEIIKRAYTKYKSKGLMVYQISFDSDAHFWKNAAVALPWITVYEPESVYSSLLKKYNIRELPTAYIINKEGDLIRRIEDFNKLEEQLGQIL